MHEFIFGRIRHRYKNLVILRSVKSVSELAVRKVCYYHSWLEVNDTICFGN